MLTTTCFSANISLLRTSGSVVEYRLAKARVAGSNPVSCSEDSRKLESFFYCIFGHSRTLGRSGNHPAILLLISETCILSSLKYPFFLKMGDVHPTAR